MSRAMETPEPPYFAAIFTSMRRAGDEGYAGMAEKMVALAKLQPGFLGMESTRDGEGFGITVSYWESLEAIKAWHLDAAHGEAQRLGREKWYESFALRICRVERAYSWPK